MIKLLNRLEVKEGKNESLSMEKYRTFLQMEDKEKAFQDFLNKMTPEEQYYYLKELPTKEPWLSWTEGKTISTIKKR